MAAIDGHCSEVFFCRLASRTLYIAICAYRAIETAAVCRNCAGRILTGPSLVSSSCYCYIFKLGHVIFPEWCQRRMMQPCDHGGDFI